MGPASVKSGKSLMHGISDVDELCDELMLHIFGCDKCINGQEATCSDFCALQRKITDEGGPTRGMLLFM